MAALTTIVFDFDGTLVRTREASWALFRETNERFGLGVDSAEAFYHLFDRNFYAALDEVSGGAGTERAGEVRRHFQALLGERYNPDLVPGMANVVHELAAHYALVILSSNTMEAVRRILLANGLAQCFAHVFSGDVAPDKHEAIQRLLDDPSVACGRRCSPHYEESTALRIAEAGEVMLVTDTVGDVEEGRRAGIRVGAVAWGMHPADALERAGAEFTCIWPEELVAYLRPGEHCADGPCRLPSPGAAAGSSRPVPRVAVVEAGELRRARRLESAGIVASRLTDEKPRSRSERCGCSSGQTGGDPLLRRALAVLSRAEGSRA
ncbi:MAG TPA: HAD hydrolase-like protein [Actinomycetota bacterium]|nr:HAD hydrolase-like protein [Actinomycetota bacterium]